MELIERFNRFSLRMWLLKILIGKDPVLANWIVRETVSLRHTRGGRCVIIGNKIIDPVVASAIIIQVD